MMFQIGATHCSWVANEDSMAEALAALQEADAIAVDVEGDCLGHGGRAATIQLATESACFVVDLAALGVSAGLRMLLQGDRPVKVCHGFSGDQINLIEQYGIDFADAALFDTQVAADFIEEREGGDRKGRSVIDILARYTSAPAGVLAEMKAMKERLRYVNFFERPLPENVVHYSCLDVVFLGSAYSAMSKRFDELGLAALPDVMDQSRYRGPYGRGSCYRPPTAKQRENKAQQGKAWCEETRDWVRSGPQDGTNGRGGGGGYRSNGKGKWGKSSGGYGSEGKGVAQPRASWL
mmetsp:Transcript_97034/g.278833  ORF Transcript_97034/g.278833 Transcript_97034/m.278833 type:complete len:293 (+) Transcript_97034:172-1050(+)